MKYFQYSIFVTSFIGCVGTEPAIKTYNAEPTFQIQSHGDGHIFEEGENIHFMALRAIPIICQKICLSLGIAIKKCSVIGQLQTLVVSFDVMLLFPMPILGLVHRL